MAQLDLSNVFVSSSFNRLLQKDSEGKLFDGLGNLLISETLTLKPVDFSAISYAQIPNGSYFIGLDSNNSGAFSKIDSSGSITTLGGGFGDISDTNTIDLSIIDGVLSGVLKYKNSLDIVLNSDSEGVFAEFTSKDVSQFTNDQEYLTASNLLEGTGIEITGTYPNFTISSTISGPKGLQETLEIDPIFITNLEVKTGEFAGIEYNDHSFRQQIKLGLIDGLNTHGIYLAKTDTSNIPFAVWGLLESDPILGSTGEDFIVGVVTDQNGETNSIRHSTKNSLTFTNIENDPEAVETYVIASGDLTDILGIKGIAMFSSIDNSVTETPISGKGFFMTPDEVAIFNTTNDEVIISFTDDKVEINSSVSLEDSDGVKYVKETDITDQVTVFIDATPDEITTGKKAQKVIDFNCSISQWTIIAGQTGSIEFDIRKSTFSDYPSTTTIIDMNPPAISNQTKGTGSSTSGWTTIDSGDIIEIYVSSNSSIQNVGLYLKLQKI